MLGNLAMGFVFAQAAPAAPPDGTTAVSLVDDRDGAALFDSAGLRPGRVETACVALSVTGSAEALGEVGLSAQVTRADLAPYLHLTVERGHVGDLASCASFSGQPVWSGTLAQLPGTPAAGIPTGWRPRLGVQMVYRFTVSVLDDPRAQGLGASATFVWALDVEPTPPAPTPAPGTAPAPAPGTAPAPAPGTAPAPAPGTAPAPAPGTAPAATPPPSPAPAATSGPAPSPTPSPTPTATSGSTPSPVPATSSGSPSPSPTPAPPVNDPDSGVPPGRGDVVQAPPLQASPSTVAKVVAAAGETALAVVNDGQFPLALVAVVVGFLFVQGRLDRRDPKLALARVRQDLTDFRDFPEMPRTAQT